VRINAVHQIRATLASASAARQAARAGEVTVTAAGGSVASAVTAIVNTLVVRGGMAVEDLSAGLAGRSGT